MIQSGVFCPIEMSAYLLVFEVLLSFSFHDENLSLIVSIVISLFISSNKIRLLFSNVLFHWMSINSP